MAQPSRTNLPFPPEIRDRIYKLVLVHDSPVKISASPEKCLELLLVCKHVCLEAFHIFYQSNTLELKDCKSLEKFLKNIGSARRTYVTHLRVQWAGGCWTARQDSFEAKQACRMLRQCPNLEFLDVYLGAIRGMYTYQMQKGYGLVALREVRGLKEVQFILRGRNDYPPEPQTEVQLTEAWMLANKTKAEIELLKGLTAGMTRPRLEKFTLDADAKIDLFEERKKHTRKSARGL